MHIGCQRGRSHAMSRGENSSDYQTQKVTALEDGLSDDNRQCGIQEAKTTGERKGDGKHDSRATIGKSIFNRNTNPTATPNIPSAMAAYSIPCLRRSEQLTSVFVNLTHRCRKTSLAKGKYTRQE